MKKNAFEWTVFALSVALIAAVVGTLVYEAITQSTDEPLIEVRLGEPRHAGRHYVVPVTSVNLGDGAADTVAVEVTLTPAEGKEEQGQCEFAHLPGHSEREGSVTFDTDPATAKELKARVLGYQKP